MSDHTLFSRYKANEIRAELQSFEVKKSKVSAVKRKNGLRKIIANLTLGNYNEMAYLLPEILRFWKIEDDLEVKRICHEFVRSLGAVNPKNSHEALPYIIADLKNRNEKIQIMALKSLVAVPSPEFVEEASRIIPSFIVRRSVPPEVTRTAIYALKQLDEVNHSTVMECLPSLFDLIERENIDPIIHVAALHTLHYIHDMNRELEPLKLSIHNAFDSLSLLTYLNEWDKALVLDALTISAVPETHDDAHEMIAIALPQLQHVNTYVALNAFKFIAYLLNYVDHVNESLIKRFSKSIISLLNKPSELQFLVLRNVILLLLSREVPLLKVDVSYFFIEFNDPIYIKDTKLECLYLLADKETLPRILEELEQYATDIDIQMSRKAIRAIGNLAVKLDENSASDCVSALLELLEFGVDYVVQEIISVFRNILRKHPHQFKSSIGKLVKYIDSVQEPESKNAMIWIITNYHKNMPDYLKIFEIFSSNFLDETLDVQFSILNSSVKFFVRDPNPQTEKTCMQILKCCTEEVNNPDLRNRAFIYWSLLSLTQTNKGHLLSNESLKTMVDGELPVIELNTKLDPIILEELELNIGTVASIYLKPVTQIFRNCRPKHLLISPALNKEREKLMVVDDSSSRTNSEPLDTLLEFQSKGGSKESNGMVNSLHKKQMMNDYDKPAETVNQLKGKRKSSSLSPSKLSRKPSMLVRKLSIRKPFS